MYRTLIASVNTYMRTTAVARFGCRLACLLLLPWLAEAADPPASPPINPPDERAPARPAPKAKRGNRPRADGTNAPQATAAESLTVLRGFKAELLRSAEAGEGSWICMTVDQKGRLIISPEAESLPLLRVTLGGD